MFHKKCLNLFSEFIFIFLIELKKNRLLFPNNLFIIRNSSLSVYSELY